jgi:hypothetical protein
MVRKRSIATATTASTTTALGSKSTRDHESKAKELFLDEDDQTEIVGLLRKQAQFQQRLMERVQRYIGVAAGIVAILLPFLSEAFNSSLVWMHAVYTAALVVFVSRGWTIRKRLSSPMPSYSSTRATASNDTISLRWLILFCLSSLPMAMWISAFARWGRNYDTLTSSSIVLHLQQQTVVAHLCLSLISLITFGGALLVDYDAQSTERALKELEASKYRFKSL